MVAVTTRAPGQFGFINEPVYDSEDDAIIIARYAEGWSYGLIADELNARNPRKIVRQGIAGRVWRLRHRYGIEVKRNPTFTHQKKPREYTPWSVADERIAWQYRMHTWRVIADKLSRFRGRTAVRNKVNYMFAKGRTLDDCFKNLNAEWERRERGQKTKRQKVRKAIRNVKESGTQKADRTGNGDASGRNEART